MVKQRNIAVYIILTIVTCGLFGIYWFVCLTDDANSAAGVIGTSGIVAWLLSVVTCGIYSLYWLYKQGEKIDTANSARGVTNYNTGILYLILGLLGFGIVAYALMQYELNKIASQW